MTIIYDELKSKFIRDIDSIESNIEDTLEDRIYERMKRVTSTAEKRARKNSLIEMYKIIKIDEIPDDSRVSIEYNIPCWWKRIDFIISWLDENKKDVAVIIELKQWESVETTDKDAVVKTWVAKALREELHPSYQILSYADLLNDYSEFVEQQPVNILPCAFLHNYLARDNKIDNEFYSEYIRQAPIFLQSDKRKLQEFIIKYVRYWDKKDIIFNIENGKIRPSKALADSLVWMVEWNKEFTLIDEQKVVFEEAKKLAKLSHKDWKKRVLIVKWWPGTWKSVVAINLLADLNKEKIVSQYVSKNSSVRNVFVEKLTKKYKKTAIKNLFLSSGTFVNSKSNEIWCLIVDEAHRLNEKSWLFGAGENQVKEIINASLCSIFFIDENQKVTLKDIWSIDEIKKWTKYYGISDNDIVEMELVSQFRCWWSDWYLAWLDNALWIRETANITLSDIDYDFQVFDSPTKMKEAIVNKNEKNNKSRVVAWYCWDWIPTWKNDSNVFDITIPDSPDTFKMSWNLWNDQIYAISDTSINEIWCIHTVQWLEFDYVGVIIWEDILYRNWKLITFPKNRAKTDKSLFWRKSLVTKKWFEWEELVDKIIRNTYRVLMSRWMKWCYIYCTDSETREYFRKMAE